MRTLELRKINPKIIAEITRKNLSRDAGARFNAFIYATPSWAQHRRGGIELMSLLEEGQ